MTDTNILDIGLRFVVDKNSQAAALQAIQAVGKNPTINTAAYAQQGDGLDDLRNQFTQATADADDFADSLQKVQTGWDADNEVKRGLEDYQRGLRKAIEDNEKLQYVFTRVGVAGAAILAPMVASANAYVQYAGRADEVSRAWLNSTDRLGNAQLRIGRTVAQEILPALEAAAAIAEKIAAFAEQNPEFVKAGLNAGALLATVGAVGSAVTVVRGVATRVALLSAGGAAASGATGAAAGGAAGGLASAGATGALLAVAAGLTALPSLLGKSLGEKLGTWQFAGNLIAKNVQSAGNLVGGEQVGTQAYQAVARALGLLGNQAESTANQINAAASQLGPSAAVVNAFSAYQQQAAQAERQNASQRAAIVQSGADQIAQIEQSTASQRAQIVAQAAKQAQQAAEDEARARVKVVQSLAKADQQANEDYYHQRSQVAVSAGKEAERAEEDHQRRLREIQQDAQDTLEDQADSRDALGMLRTLREAEKQRAREEESYNLQTARRDQDLAERLAEMDANFAQQKARRMADAAERLAEMAEDAALRRQREQQQTAERLAELDASAQQEIAQTRQDTAQKLTELQRAYAQEKQARFDAFGQQLRDLGYFHQQYSALETQWYQARMDAFQQFANANGDSLAKIALPGKAAGKYTSGPVMTGERGYEYILDHDLTTAMERAAGGSLTNEKIYGMMGGNRTQMSNNFRFDGRISADDRRWIMDVFDQKMGEYFNVQ